MLNENSSPVTLVGMEFEENLSTRYLASALRRSGFKFHLLSIHAPDEMQNVLSAILELNPFLVGISIPFQAHAQHFLDLCRKLRTLNYNGHICLGGHFPTFEHQAILRDFPEVDSVICHDGEATLPELCLALNRGDPIDLIPGLVSRTPTGITLSPKRSLLKLDSLPFPDRPKTPHQALGINCAPIIGSRGCYANCSFCCINAYAHSAQGPRYRQRTPENIVQEMKQEFEARGVRLFVFHDDNFLIAHQPSNMRRYSRLATCLVQAGLTDIIGLVIKCRPSDVDLELFSLLKSMGLIRAYVGIESHSQAGLITLNRNISQDENYRALSILNELDIYHSFNVLIFDPETGLDDVRVNLDFIEQFSETPSNFCRAEVYAGTPLKQMLLKEGRLQGNYLAWNYALRDPQVEMLFRIASVVFSTRNFKCDGIANLNMGIRFDYEVFRRFYPAAAQFGGDMFYRLKQLSSDIAKSSVLHMRNMINFVEVEDIYDDKCVQKFTIETSKAISTQDLAFLIRIKGLKNEMYKHAFGSEHACTESAVLSTCTYNK